MQYLILVPIVCGSLYSVLAWLATHRFFAQPKAESTDRPFAPVTVIKPVMGLTKNLERNLRSLCDQDYPDFQVVMAVQRLNDPALPLLHRLADEYGEERVSIVADERGPDGNGKIQNLCTAMAAVRHEIIVISDSDVRAAPDYLTSIVAPLADPDVAYACTLYRVAGADDWYEKLELLSLNADFTPSVIFSYITGASHFCLGASQAFRRSDLESIGGFAALSDIFVEDYELGQRLLTIRPQMVLAPYVVELQVDLASPWSWLCHQLRWDLATKTARPLGYFGTILIRAIPFALLFAAIRGFDGFGVAVLAGVLVTRWATAGHTLHALLCSSEGLRALWMLPIRDVMAIFVWGAVHLTHTVTWGPNRFRLASNGRIALPGGGTGRPARAARTGIDVDQAEPAE